TSPQEIYHRNNPSEPLDGTSRMKLYTAEVSLNAPFKLGEQKLRYSGLIRAQWNRTPLMSQDRFAIGGRYTVRGFDGETSLMGERGWLIRNDIGWAIPTGSGQSGAELYVGADYGHVGGRSTVDGLGRSLAGAVIGVRGQWSKLSYD
ncbi:ShlB/FhaC/HecB family hemolysin secretion/activation protein, partial [Variovorax sp. DXTD-1]|uniref:ShlB/FhaC/HecB family hemolysin secretion/activation protein n=1 Tax=Variovorax sp. DXTD-1 TaxID=2495592 RepID=UPI000FC2085F